MLHGGSAGEDEGIAAIKDAAVSGTERLRGGCHQRQVVGSAAQRGDAGAEGRVVAAITGVEDDAAAKFRHG